MNQQTNRGDYKMEQIETLWINGEISNNGVIEVIKIRKALQTLESALKYHKTSKLSWKKCIKKVGK